MGRKRHFSQGGRHVSDKQRRDDHLLRRDTKNKCAVATPDRPMPLIDIGIDRIEKLIKSVTGHFEDDYQDAWVKVLEQQPTTEEEILDISKKASRRNRSKAIEFRRTSLDKPILNQQGEELTLKDALTASGEEIYSRRIMKEPKNASVKALSQGQCKYCSSTSLRRYGIRHGKRGICQRFCCKVCGHVFTANGAVGKMHYPQYVIREFIKLRNLGHSFSNIQKRLYASYKVKMSSATLFYWSKKVSTEIKYKNMRYGKDKSQLIMSLNKLERKASLSKEDILTTCGYSLKTKIEGTLLVKLGLITKTSSGWLVKAIE